MPKFVGFLRGINVGGHRKIPMAALRALVADLTQCNAVQTYIASGNIVFEAEGTARDVAARLQIGIKDRFGFAVPTLVLNAAEMRDVKASCPWQEEKGNLVTAYLCYDDPQLDIETAEGLRAVSESLAVRGRTVWLHAPEGFGRSKLAAKMDRLLGVEATARNLNTVVKMVEMLNDAPK